ncbi:hypothetical protein D3C81_2097790 [compost metagenome]
MPVEKQIIGDLDAIRLSNMTVERRHVVLALEEANHALLDIPHTVHSIPIH